jgi:NAD(P)H-dependent FMN reductase
MKPDLAIIATSLDPDSRSQLLARAALEVAKRREISTTLVDLREFDIPLCGTAACWESVDAERIRKILKPASHIVFAVAIYNFDVNAAAKNIVELMGSDVFEDKTIGFICAAGGRSSYMSVLAFANSLMLDFRCWIAPRFVYATGEDFEKDAIKNPEITTRIENLIDDLLLHTPKS